MKQIEIDILFIILGIGLPFIIGIFLVLFNILSMFTKNDSVTLIEQKYNLSHKDIDKRYLSKEDATAYMKMWSKNPSFVQTELIRYIMDKHKIKI